MEGGVRALGVLAVCDAKLCTQTSLGVTGRGSVRVVAHCAASARRVARIRLLMKRFVQICY